MRKMIRTDIYLGSLQHKLLKKEAEREGITMSEIIRKSIDRYLEGRHATGK